MLTEILHSPLTYLVLLVSFAGGFYARGKLSGAVAFGWLAPLLLMPMWFVALMAISLPVNVAQACFPNLTGAVEAFAGGDSALAEVLAVALNPNLLAAIIVAALFAGLCRYERVTRLAGPSSKPRTRRKADSHAMLPARVRRRPGLRALRARYLDAPRKS